MPGRRKLSPSAPGAASPTPWTVVTPLDARPLGERSADAIAHHTPRHLASMFTAADLPGQFVLSRTDDAVPAGWTIHRLRGWTLGVHPFLPVSRMVTCDGLEAGWLLGFPISEHSQFIEGSAHLPFDRHSSPRAMEAWLSRLCGRFLAVWLAPMFERVYLDAGGLLSAVFAKEHDLVCSTTSLVPYTRGCEDDGQLLRRSRMPEGRAVLGFGLTSRYGVERIHANHYLDLNRWTTHRHWPTEPLDGVIDPAEAIDTVARMIRRHVTAATSNGKIQMALTAGYDSRSILACSREFLPDIELMTIAIPDNTGRLDVETATKMAAKHGLNHRILAHQPPTQHDLDSWLWRTGSCVSEPRGWRASRSYSQARPAAEVTGAGGEAARVAYWRDAGLGKIELTPHVLVDCINLPPSAGVLANAHVWMSSYPASTKVQMLDGFFIEQSMGVVAGSLAYGDAGYVRRRIYPYINREAIEAMLRLPEKYKIERRFPVDLIRHEWPGLLGTPFNRRSGVRHRVDRFRRRAWFWRRALAGKLQGR